MAIVSIDELPGSPVQQMVQEQTTRYWNPAPKFSGAVSLSAPTCVVLAYSAANPTVTTDVSATVLLAGSPFLGTGANAGYVGWTIAKGTLVPGTEYRCTLGVTNADGSEAGAFLRIICVL